MMRCRTFGLLVCVLLLGCESDAEKVHRLEMEAAMTRVRELRYVEQGAPVDSIAAAHIRRVLAERALNQFMAGR